MADDLLDLFNKSRFNKPTPSSYNKFDLEPDPVNFSKFLQSGDPIGKRNTYVPRRSKSGEPAAAAPVCPTVQTFLAKNITSQSLTLSGSVTLLGSGISEKGFVVSTSDTSPTIEEGGTKYLVSGSSAGEYNYNLTGLTANTAYYYQAYVSSSRTACGGTIYNNDSRASTTLTASAAEADLTLKVFTKIYQSDGRPLNLETQRNDYIGEAGTLPTSLKRRVAVWSASSADLYDTVNVGTRTGTSVKVSGTIESQRDGRYSGSALIDVRSGSYLYSGDYSTPYAYDGGNAGWLLMQREDNNQVFLGYYDSAKFVEVPVPTAGDPQSPISASIYRIDNGSGSIINDGTDTLAVTGSTMVSLTKITSFTGNDSIIRSLQTSATASIADHSQFKCTARLDQIGFGSKSGYGYYGISSDMLPLVTGKVISEGVLGNGGGDHKWPGTNDIAGKNFVLEGKVGELYPVYSGSYTHNSSAFFIVSASSDGTIIQSTRIDNGSGSIVNDGSDGLNVCT